MFSNGSDDRQAKGDDSSSSSSSSSNSSSESDTNDSSSELESESESEINKSEVRRIRLAGSGTGSRALQSSSESSLASDKDTAISCSSSYNATNKGSHECACVSPGTTRDRRASSVSGRSGTSSCSGNRSTSKNTEGSSGFQPNLARNSHSFTVFLASAPAFLGPMSTTIYLPALTKIQADLNATAVEMTLSISLFTLMLGIFPLVYATYSDDYGRRNVLLVTVLGYCLASILCVVCWAVWVLLLGRILQAICISSVMVVGAGIIADVTPQEQRGSAMGWFSVAPLVGPVLGPVVGGVIAEFLSWRFVFGFLVLCGFVVLVLEFFLLPETLVVREEAKEFRARRRTKHRNDCCCASSCDSCLFGRFPNPFRPLKFLSDPRVLVVALLAGLLFGSMYAWLFRLSTVLAAPKKENGYGLSALNVGLSLIPFGVGTITGSPLGGRFVDICRVRFGQGGRLLPTFLSALLFPFAVIWLAAMLESGLAWPLLASFGMGFSLTFSRPGMVTYCMECHKHASASVNGTIICAQFALAFAILTASTPAIAAIGDVVFAVIGAIFLVPAVFAVGISGLVDVRRDAKVWDNDARPPT